ncbi:hypothetical protein ACYSNW_16230 [Enterococcus sp. LJL99]
MGLNTMILVGILVVEIVAVLVVMIKLYLSCGSFYIIFEKFRKKPFRAFKYLTTCFFVFYGAKIVLTLNEVILV